MQDVANQIRPFTATVGINGQAIVQIGHSLHGLAWIIYQIGLSLGQAAPSPEISAIVNGVPFVSSVVMSTANLASFPGAPPAAMVSAFSGPPYPMLEAGDLMQIGVIGAKAGDTFTAGVFMQEIDSPTLAAAVANTSDFTSGHISRAGTARW